MHAGGWKPRRRQAQKTRDRKSRGWCVCSNKAPYVRTVKNLVAGEPLCSLRWCRLEAGARRNEEEQPAGWGGLLALLTVMSSPVRVGRLEMLSVSDKSLS
jgi:hypothetical protein